MKIGMISYWSCPLTRLGTARSGGMSVYILHLANALGILGHRVDIYTRSHHEYDTRIINLHQNVRLIHLSSLTKNLYQDVKIFAKKLSDFMKKNGLTYDIFHSHYFYSGLIGTLLRKESDVPCIMTFHTLGKMKELYTGFHDRMRIKAEEEIIKNTDGIIVSTELEQNDLIKAYMADKNKISIIHPGVNHHIFKKYHKKRSRRKLLLSTNKKIILFVGRIDPVKGINLLLKATDRLLRLYPQLSHKFILILIGGNIKDRNFWIDPEVQLLKKYIKSNRLERHVKFIGSQPYHMLPYYYSASDIVVLPSVYETFGLVVIEAMACGSCVAASKVGGLKCLIKDRSNGRLFQTGDYKGLVKIIWELLTDKKQRTNLGKRAEKFSQKYCWHKQAKKMLKVYRKYL